jgi:hypothetical protein
MTARAEEVEPSAMLRMLSGPTRRWTRRALLHTWGGAVTPTLPAVHRRRSARTHHPPHRGGRASSGSSGDRCTAKPAEARRPQRRQRQPAAGGGPGRRRRMAVASATRSDRDPPTLDPYLNVSFRAQGSPPSSTAAADVEERPASPPGRTSSKASRRVGSSARMARPSPSSCARRLIAEQAALNGRPVTAQDVTSRSSD